MRYTPIFHFILLSSVLFLNSSSVTFADQTNGSCNADGMCNFKSCDVKKLRATSIQSTDKAPASNADGIQWQPYSPEAVNKAKLTHQMVIVFSKSDSCYWSQQMEKMTLSDPSVIKKIKEQYVPIVFIFDEDSDIAKQYQISSLPTMIILDANGNKVKEFTGFIPAKDMVTKLNALVPASH